MEKSLFAGLTILDEDESILEDAGAFVGRDREIIDRLLELGAKTHRHIGGDGLLDPNQALGASAVASAGTLPGDLTFSIGYTLEDSDRGETLISPLVTLTTPPVIERPLFAPVGAISYAAGSLPTDTYYYAISYTDAEGGETQVGPAVPVERQPGFANAQVELSGLTNGMVAAGASGWRLYRAVGGGDFHFLDSGSIDTYTDDGSVPVQPDLQPLPENVNTTNNDNGVLLRLPSADARVGESSYINVYMSEDGSFSGDVFLQQFPVSSAGQEVFYPSVTLFGEQPPDVNNSIGGAHQIDPDTELLDWHWLRPVAAPYALGSGVLGDVRIATNTGQIFGMLAASGSGAAAWTVLPSGGVGANLGATDEDGPEVNPLTLLDFRASGAASVGVTDEGGGVARVTIFAASGGASGAGGNTPAASARGDILVASGDLSWKDLPVGADDEVLIADNTVPLGVRWGTAPGFPFSIENIDNVGDLIVGDADNSVSVLPNTANDGDVLTASGAAPLGVEWDAPRFFTPGPMPDDFITPYDPILVQNNVAVPGANQARACLVVVPKAGRLRDLHVYVGTSSGNVEGAIYDSEGTRNKLWSSGSIACPAGSNWGSLGDPDLVVYRGQLLYFVIAADNATATFGRANALGTTGLNQLPAGFWAGEGHTPKRAVTIASFTPGSAPATISEANMVITTFCPMLIARVE
jgi:hypothetical protein